MEEGDLRQDAQKKGFSIKREGMKNTVFLEGEVLRLKGNRLPL